MEMQFMAHFVSKNLGPGWYNAPILSVSQGHCEWKGLIGLIGMYMPTPTDTEDLLAALKKNVVNMIQVVRVTEEKE